MGAGASLGQGGTEGVRCASPSPMDAMRVKLLSELRHEKSKDENGKDVTDHHAEVIRLRSWLRDVDGILTRMIGEAAEQASGVFDDKNADMPETKNVLEDGTVIYYRDDGYHRQEDTDGVVIHCWPDGRKKQVHPNGREQETMPDNTRITRTEDGKLITKRPDGSKYQVNPDGTTISVTRDGIVEQYNPSVSIKLDAEAHQLCETMLLVPWPFLVRKTGDQGVLVITILDGVHQGLFTALRYHANTQITNEMSCCLSSPLTPFVFQLFRIKSGSSRI